jgi:hypothetical protein
MTKTVLPIPFWPCAPKCISADKVPNLKITNKLLQRSLYITTVICPKVKRTRQRRHLRNVDTLAIFVFVIVKNVATIPQDEAIADMIEIGDINDSDTIIVVTSIERHVEGLWGDDCVIALPDIERCSKHKACSDEWERYVSFAV